MGLTATLRAQMCLVWLPSECRSSSVLKPILKHLHQLQLYIIKNGGAVTQTAALAVAEEACHVYMLP